MPLRHPGLAAHRDDRSLQDRAADAITAFAGSMAFVYLHTVWFIAWIICAVEDYPYGLLTMIVSLEAIFLSTFVLISQNRSDEKRRAIAEYDHQMLTELHTEHRQMRVLIERIADEMGP